jgi:hypothetical protein
MDSDSLLKLLNILCPTLSERSLCLAITLLTLFRRGINLPRSVIHDFDQVHACNVQAFGRPSSLAVLGSLGETDRLQAQE